MDFILDLLQGIGIAAAIGIRPFLPTLLAGALAAANLGLDFDRTDFSFLEGVPFLAVILVLVIALGLLERRREPEGDRTSPVTAGLIAVALILAALEASGSLADRSSTWWPGLIAGPAAAGLGFAAARSLFGRVRRRLDADTAGALPLYAEASALAAAGLSILFPPLAILVVAGLAWLLVGGRRRAGQKYAGLRILR
jgi:hypothetical protein